MFGRSGIGSTAAFVLLTAALSATVPRPLAVHAQNGASANLMVKVEGALAKVAAKPVTLRPTFDPSITDYVVRCNAGSNLIDFTLTAAAHGVVNVYGNNGKSVVLKETLVENQALILDWHGPNTQAGTQYWIRCLPHDFPLLNVNEPGTPPPGWYLTGNLFSATNGATYAMVLDNHGTPVWYR